MRSKGCANRSRMDGWSSRGRSVRSSSPLGSRSSLPRTRVRAGSTAILAVSVGAGPTAPRSTARSCRDRSSTGSTCGSGCLVSPRPNSWVSGPENHPMSSAIGSSVLATCSALAGRRSGSPATGTFPGRWPVAGCTWSPQRGVPRRCGREHGPHRSRVRPGAEGRADGRRPRGRPTVVTAGHMAEALSYRDGFGGEGLSRAG